MNYLRYIALTLLLTIVTDVTCIDATGLKVEQALTSYKKGGHNHTQKPRNNKHSNAIKPNTSKAKISSNALKHINKRHGPNSSAQNTSKFNSNFTDSKIKSIVSHAFNSQDAWKPSKTNPSRLVKDHTYKKPIGKNSNGTPAKTLRIVTDKNGEIVTAFPAK